MTRRVVANQIILRVDVVARGVDGSANRIVRSVSIDENFDAISSKWLAGASSARPRERARIRADLPLAASRSGDAVGAPSEAVSS